MKIIHDKFNLKVFNVIIFMKIKKYLFKKDYK